MELIKAFSCNTTKFSCLSLNPLSISSIIGGGKIGFDKAEMKTME